MPARPSGRARGRTCSPSASSRLFPGAVAAPNRGPMWPSCSIPRRAWRGPGPDNVSGTRSSRVVWPAEAENRPPAPRKDICKDQQLAALLAAWWGSGDRDAARVLADARGRSLAAGDREGIGTAHVAEIV